jgi:hypothetical protein
MLRTDVRVIQDRDQAHIHLSGDVFHTRQSRSRSEVSDELAA